MRSWMLLRLRRARPALRARATLGLVLGVGLVLGLALVPALLAPAPARAAEISWADLDGGSFQDAGNWQDTDGGAVSEPPGPGDFAAFDLGDGDVSLSGPVTLDAATETSSLGVLGGAVELDLSGHDYSATASSEEGALLVFPRVAGRVPSLTLSNSAGTEAAFRADVGSVGLSDGGALRVEGPDTRLEALHVAVGVVNPEASDAGTGSPSALTVDAGTLGAISRIDVGSTQDGAMVVEKGAQVVELPNSTGDKGLGIFLGDASGTFGDAVVRDAGTRVEAKGVVVGGRGRGRLALQDGAELTARDRILVAGELPAEGETESRLEVGGGSVLETSLLQIGRTTTDTGESTLGVGTFALTEGTARVDALVADTGGLGQLELDGGLLSVGRFLEVDTGAPLHLGGAVELDFTRAHHSADFGDEVVLGAGSELRLNGGRLEAPAITPNGGSFVWNAGSLLLDDDATAGQAPDALLPAELTLDDTRPFLQLGGTLTIDGDTTTDPSASGGAVTLATGGELRARSIERVNGGSFSWTGGDLTLGSGLAIEEGGLVGSDVTLGADRSLRVFGTTTIVEGSSLTLDAGAFRTQGLEGSGFTWNAGTLDVRSLRAGTGPDALSSELTLGADRTLRVNDLFVDDAVVTVAGGAATVESSLAIDADAGGRLDFDTGSLEVRAPLTVGPGGLTGAGGASTVTLGAGDSLAVDFFGDSGGTTIAGGAALEVSGGAFETEALTLEETGALRYGSGRLDVDQGFRVGGGGVQDLGGSATVTLGSDDQFLSFLGRIAVADGSTVALEGGTLLAEAIDLEGSGAVHYDSGAVLVSERLEVGAGGLLGTGGSSTVSLAPGDLLHTGNRLVVGSGATLAVDGGTVDATTLDASEGSAHFSSGSVDASGVLAVSDAGLLGAAGAPTLALGTSDELSARVLQLGSGHGVAIQGGTVDAGAIQGGGSLSLETGELSLLEQDLYIGSSFTDSDVADSDGDGVNEGYRLASNTASGADFFYRIGDGTDVFVGREHTTHVDASGLEIGSGGRLSTWELDAPSNVTVRDGGTLDVRHLVFDTDTLFDGEATVELVDVGAALTLGSNAKLFSQTAAVAEGGSVTLEGDATLGSDTELESGASLSGTGTVEGKLVNSGTLEPGASPGTLTVEGAFEQRDPGSLVLELGRDAETEAIVHDLLAASGSVLLDGEVELQIDTSSEGLDSLFDPASEGSLSFTALRGDGVEGRFDELLAASVGNDLKWVVEYFHNRVDLSLLSSSSPDLIDHRLTTVPEPGTALLLAAGLVGLAFRRGGRPSA